MANTKVYIVVKDGEQLKELKTLAAAKKLADAEGAEVFCEGEMVYVGTPAQDEEVPSIVEEAEVFEAEKETLPEIKPDIPAVERYTLTAKMNIRNAPSKGAEKLGIAQPGTVVEVTEIVDDWLHLKDGRFILYEGGKFARKSH